MSRVVVVGSFNVDHVWTCAALPRAGETLGGHYRSGPGGKGFNQAVACARAGADTRFVCALGDDAGGQLARALAIADGIGLHALHSAQPTGTAGIYVDDAGRNCIVVGAGANAALSAAHVAAQQQAFAGAGVVLAQLESPAAAIVEAMRCARRHGATTLLNPAPANADASAGLLALCDLITPNESEFAGLVARQLGERIDGDAVAALGHAALHALCRRLLPHGSVVVTLGASGCFASHASDKPRGDDLDCYRIAAERARVVDTTGAGDAFNGALAAALARDPGTAFAQHLRFASRYAALSTESAGAAVAMPQRDDVVARFGTSFP